MYSFKLDKIEIIFLIFLFSLSLSLSLSLTHTHFAHPPLLNILQASNLSITTKTSMEVWYVDPPNLFCWCKEDAIEVVTFSEGIIGFMQRLFLFFVLFYYY